MQESKLSPAAQFMKLFNNRLLFFIVFLEFIGLGIAFGQTNFTEQCGMIRQIQNGKYSFKYANEHKTLDLSAFTFASDFTENRAIVKGHNENTYGAIDLNGKLILDTIYARILPSQYGFMLVSREIAGYVIEDRGAGERKYARSEWLLAQSETGYVIDEIRFESATQIGGTLLATDNYGKDFTINVQKINLALYDPFMKAIVTIDDQPVHTIIDQDAGSIIYASKNSNQLMLANPININPEEKYQVSYTNR